MKMKELTLDSVIDISMADNCKLADFLKMLGERFPDGFTPKQASIVVRESFEMRGNAVYLERLEPFKFYSKLSEQGFLKKEKSNLAKPNSKWNYRVLKRYC